MLDSFTNYFLQHPIAMAIAAIAVIIILVWMTGSGSRQRSITFRRTKETDQLARDLSRIAAALEKIARQRDVPVDYLNRAIPHGWEASISAGEPVEDAFSEEYEPGPQDFVSEEVQELPADADHEGVFPAGAPSAAQPIAARAQAAASGPKNSPAPVPPNSKAPSPNANAPREPAPARGRNPLGGTADLLGGKKKLDLPNPLYRPKR